MTEPARGPFSIGSILALTVVLTANVVTALLLSALCSLDRSDPCGTTSIWMPALGVVSALAGTAGEQVMDDRRWFIVGLLVAVMWGLAAWAVAIEWGNL